MAIAIYATSTCSSTHQRSRIWVETMMASPHRKSFCFSQQWSRDNLIANLADFLVCEIPFLINFLFPIFSLWGKLCSGSLRGLHFNCIHHGLKQVALKPGKIIMEMHNFFHDEVVVVHVITAWFHTANQSWRFLCNFQTFTLVAPSLGQKYNLMCIIVKQEVFLNQTLKTKGMWFMASM